LNNPQTLHKIPPRQTKITIPESEKMESQLEQNKQNAVEFYKMAYQGSPREACARFVGDEYIQHNPLVGNGVKHFISYFKKMAAEYPDKRITFVRTISEDDLVALHTHQIWPGGDEYVTMDFFRFDTNGKIVEHWDAIQSIPKETLNGNTMY
jgi:predicted SnoaL-like aldol condensation-catalyzing enzyme